MRQDGAASLLTWSSFKGLNSNYTIRMDLMEKYDYQTESSGKLDSNFRTSSWEAIIKTDN